jgi:membrane protein implicated in regulation of membrane protease activity
MELLLAPAAKPFTIAALILLGLVVAEIGTMVVGNPMSQWFDHSGHPEGDGHGSLFGALDWLNAGRVPLMILIMLALGAFALIGFAMVGVTRMLFLPLPAIVASGIALVLTIPVLRTSSRALARIMPRDETYAVEEEDLVGRTAQVTVGPLDDGLPGRVKLRDSHGNWHFPRARAAKGHGPMAVGSTVLLVDREGSAFLAIPVPDELVKS